MTSEPFEENLIKLNMPVFKVKNVPSVRDATTKYCKLGGWLTKLKIILSVFWRLEVQGQVVCGVTFSRASFFDIHPHVLALGTTFWRLFSQGQRSHWIRLRTFDYSEPYLLLQRFSLHTSSNGGIDFSVDWDEGKYISS